jgi:large subunit ribosomal protein L18
MKKQSLQNRRKDRVRWHLKSSANRPRLVVFRSNKYLYAQVIDRQGKVLASASNQKVKSSAAKTKTVVKTTKTEAAKTLGEHLAQQAISQKVHQVVFDRGQYKYHGRVKALAEAARAAGLKF